MDMVRGDASLFSREEYWIGLPCPPPGDLPDPGIESVSLISPAFGGGFFIKSATWEALLVPIRSSYLKPWMYGFVEQVALGHILKTDRQISTGRLESGPENSYKRLGFGAIQQSQKLPMLLISPSL